MKEKLTKLIDEARREDMAYCVALLTDPMNEDAERVSEASFIADKLIEAGVCFRLVVPEKGEKANDL